MRIISKKKNFFPDNWKTSKLRKTKIHNHTFLSTHQDTDHVGAVETDSDRLFRNATLYIGEEEKRYLTGEKRRRVIYGLYKLPMVIIENPKVLRQESDPEFDYSVEEIVSMGRFPHHRLLDPDTDEDRQIVNRCIVRVGMLEKKDRMISTLSGGEKQRVLIARALAQETDFLVLDEPTNHLDIYYKSEILELIRSLGITVISTIWISPVNTVIICM